MGSPYISEPWLEELSAHPIFTPSSAAADPAFPAAPSASSSAKAAAARSARRHAMVVRNSDLIVAVGNEIRMASLVDAKNGKELGGGIAYKTLHTPNIRFPILTLSLNSTGKLLAVAGEHQLAVVVLPRAGYAKLMTPLVECRSIQVGQYYHAVDASPQIAKVDWHPWGEGASSLLVLTADGVLREYDVSSDTEEPQQAISFASPTCTVSTTSVTSPPRRRAGFSADDRAADEAVSFTLGSGTGDWGPLTVYGLMRNGDVYAICPFMPKHALVPPSYAHALSTFASAKVDFLSQLMPDPSIADAASLYPQASSVLPGASPLDDVLSTRYNHQLKWASGLLKQLTSAASRSQADDDGAEEDTDEPVRCAPPRGVGAPLRQGPFLMQPAPRELGDEETEATDLFYVGAQEGEGEGEGAKREDEDVPVGVIGIAYKDGKVDVCLEVEKVEARWATRQELRTEPAALAVYESIDLGLSSSTSSGTPPPSNHPTFVPDPLYRDTQYVYHALGVHALVMRPWLREFARAGSDEQALARAVHCGLETEVAWVVDTRGAADGSGGGTSVPVVSVEVVNDVYLAYSLLALTASLQLVPVELSLRVPSISGPTTGTPSTAAPTTTTTTTTEPSYATLLTEPFVLPANLSSFSGQPTQPRLLPPPSSLAGGSATLQITPDSLRFLGTTVERSRSEIRALVSSANAVQARLDLQVRELERQLDKLAELAHLAAEMRSRGAAAVGGRVDAVMRRQRELLARVDRVLQRLMDRHQPTLSGFEKAWFAELGRLGEEIKGGGGSGRALQARTARLSNQLALLRPQLVALAKQKAASPDVVGGGSAPRGLGSAQIARMERQLAEETKMIEAVRGRLETLNVKIARGEQRG